MAHYHSPWDYCHGEDKLPLKARIAVGRAITTGVLAIASIGTAQADEGGTPFWQSGQFASMAAVPDTPGWTLSVNPYYYTGSTDSSKRTQKGSTVTTGTTSFSPIVYVQPGYAFETTILGGTPFLAVSWGSGQARTTTETSTSATRSDTGRGESVWGGTDLSPFASIAWNSGNHNWMTYLTGNIPTGRYNSESLANLGIGHGALDWGGGYTYYNASTGLEFSAVAGLTYNFLNPATNVKSGVDSHLDWSASKVIGEHWAAGVAGYVYYQLTGDTGSGNLVGPYLSQVGGFGPQVSYLFDVSGQSASLNLRAYKELWADNRTQGYAIFLALTVPLGTTTPQRKQGQSGP